MKETWAAVDAYLTRLAPPDEALEQALAAAREAGVPPINVSATQGRFLQLLAELVPARRILEIGTLAGYSTIWLARGLAAGGQVTTLEIAANHAAIARQNLERAGLAEVVDIRIGPALESLAALADAGGAPYDLVFIDADKPSNPAYLEWAVRLGRPGTLIVVDNVVRGGTLADPDNVDPSVQGSRAVVEAVAAHPGLTGAAVQTVGEKGYDGFLFARVR